MHTFVQPLVESIHADAPTHVEKCINTMIIVVGMPECKSLLCVGECTHRVDAPLRRKEQEGVDNHEYL